MAKKHAPIQQLREAAKEAERMLVEKGIHTKESAIDRIANERRIVLPGIPAYLPHLWALEGSKRMLMDIMMLWINETRGDRARQESCTAFFEFVVKTLKSVEDEVRGTVDAMPALLKALKGTALLSKVFSPMQKLETVQVMQQFLVDAFAVSVVVKQHGSTSGFCDWFFDWTGEMEQYWRSGGNKKQ